MEKPFRRIRYGVEAVAADCVQRGAWAAHRHLWEQASTRGIILDEVMEVLSRGRFVKDRFKKDHVPPRCWWYTLAKEIDGREIWVALYFVEDRSDSSKPFMVAYTCYERDQD